MKKKQKKKLKRRIRASASRWKQVLGLQNWWVDVFYGWDPAEFEIGKHDAIYARARTDWSRKRIHLTFNMDEIQHLDDDELDKLVIHEMLHGIVAEMVAPEWVGLGDSAWMMMKERQERVVTTLELAVWWAYQEGRAESN